MATGTVVGERSGGRPERAVGGRAGLARWRGPLRLSPPSSASRPSAPRFTNRGPTL